jgi:quinol monooxygenase YgiN
MVIVDVHDEISRGADMLIVIGKARALPGRSEELKAAARAVAEATRGDEGCVSYGFFTDVADENTVLSMETWADRAALEAHMKHEHTQVFMERTPHLVDGQPVMTMYEASQAD